jgi:hypothetical protein
MKEDPMAKTKQDSRFRATVAQLLVKLQDRLNRVDLVSSQTAASVVTLSEHLVRADRGAGSETLLNQTRQAGNMRALVALRESMMTAFVRARKDIEDLQKTVGYLRKRLIVAESQAAEALEFKRELRRIVDNQRSGETSPEQRVEKGTVINDLWKGNSGCCVR